MIKTRSEIQDTSEHSILGLYGAGELPGGLYYHNNNSGLVSGAASGGIAGPEAAAFAKGMKWTRS